MGLVRGLDWLLFEAEPTLRATRVHGIIPHIIHDGNRGQVMGLSQTKEPIAIDAHGRHAQAVAFTKDGKRLVSTGQDACVRLWSVPGFQAEGVFERQTLDVYASAEGKNHPVVVWIHGGGWHSGDKKDVKHKPQVFTDKGFVFVSINYRLQVWTDPQRSPSVTIKEIAEDVARAIHWTHAHAGDYGGDPNTIFVMGHSAGAQVAALVCTDERYLKAEKPSLSIIKGCVPVDGDTYDLPMRIATVHRKGDKKLAERDQKRFGDAALQEDLSSIRHIAKGKPIPPFLILHVADHPETRGQSERLLQVLQEAGIPAKTYAAEGKNHTTLNDDLGIPDDRATKAVFGFLDAVLKR